jgi:hypothetical protein
VKSVPIEHLKRLPDELISLVGSHDSPQSETDQYIFIAILVPESSVARAHKAVISRDLFKLGKTDMNFSLEKVYRSVHFGDFNETHIRLFAHSSRPFASDPGAIGRHSDLTKEKT